MSDQETRIEDLCAHCKIKPALKRYSGPFTLKYCSLECNAIEYYRRYAVSTCGFGALFILHVIGSFFILIGVYSIDTWFMLQLLIYALGFFYSGYATIVGYRGAKRERESEAPKTPS